MSSPEEGKPDRLDDDPVPATASREAGQDQSDPDAPLPEPETVEASERPSTFVVRCPACGAETLAGLTEAGKRGRCAVCGGTFQILPPPGFGPLPGIEPAPEAPPFDGPPHRGPTIAAIGIAAILATAIATIITSCCPYIPIDVVGLTIGIVAAVMGRRDLRAMDRGVMDPAGRERTRLGFALGACAAAASAFLFLMRFGIMAIVIIATFLGAAAAPPPAPPTVPPPNSPPIPAQPAGENVIPPDVREELKP